MIYHHNFNNCNKRKVIVIKIMNGIRFSPASLRAARLLGQSRGGGARHERFARQHRVQDRQVHPRLGASRRPARLRQVSTPFPVLGFPRPVRFMRGLLRPQVVQLHAAGGAAERDGGGRGAHGLAAAARPAPHGGGAVGRGQRGEAAAGGEAARCAAPAGGGGRGGGGGRRAGPGRSTPAVVLAPGRRARARRRAAAAPPLHAPLLGRQAPPRLGRLPRHLLASALPTG